MKPAPNKRILFKLAVSKSLASKPSQMSNGRKWGNFG